MYYFQLDAFSITQYITNPISLAAFAIAAIMTYLIYKNVNARKKLEAVNELDRADVIIKTAEKLHLDIRAVPVNERAGLIRKALNNRIITQLIIAIVVIIMGFLIVYFAIEKKKINDPNISNPTTITDSLDSKVRDSSSLIKEKKRENLQLIKSTDFKEDEKIEISIQLSEGFIKILLNGDDASILPSSTPNNPRISVTSNPDKLQSIKIITKSSDTCLLESVFDKKKIKDFPIRFTPICKPKN